MLDSDGIMVRKGTKVLESETNEKFKVDFDAFKMDDRIAEKVNRLKGKIKICIASGRHMLSLKNIYGKVFDRKMMFISENGNFLYQNGKNEQMMVYEDEYYELLAKIKEATKKFPGVNGCEPKENFISINCNREIKEMYKIVEDLDKNKILQVMWVADEVFDVLHKDMSKGVGVRLVMERLGLDRENVIAIGDGLNDVAMLEEAGIAVSGNPEKIKMPYWTTGEELPGEQLIDYLLENL